MTPAAKKPYRAPRLRVLTPAEVLALRDAHPELAPRPPTRM